MSQNPYEPQPAASLVSGGYFPGQVPGTQASSAPAQRLVAMEEEPEEKMIEAALRPKSLDDFVGQRRVRQQLSLVLEASKMRGRSADHVLLSGPPGLGKTTLAMIIAAEMEAPLRITSGPAIQHSGDLAAILSSLTPGEVLFLDEIHRMSRPAEEMLYMAMEDFRVDIVVGKGAGATSIPLELPQFTLVGATTRAGLLPGPLRDRFGFTGHLEFYSVEELELVLRRSAGLMDMQITSEGFTEIAGRSRGTPRIANRLLRRVRQQLSLVLEASKMRGRSADHVLLSGPPGLGKTTLAMIIAAEMEAPLRITSGPAIQHSGDLAAILSSLTPGEVLFLDEIHRMSRPAEEMLYMAMEDFRVDIVVGKGAGATSIPLELPQFTLVGATTRAGLLPGPLRDRFGFTGHLEFYSVEELELVLRRSAGLMDMQITSEGFTEIAGRSRGTPRIANRLLRRVRDWALVNGVDRINARDAATALDMYEVDSRGLDRLDRAVLEALIHKFGGGPVGLSTLAIAVGEETETVETVAEPYLVREGLIGRTPRGRVALPAAWEHLGLEAPEIQL